MTNALTQKQVPDGVFCVVITSCVRVPMYGAEARLKWQQHWKWERWVNKIRETIGQRQFQFEETL